VIIIPPFYLVALAISLITVAVGIWGTRRNWKLVGVFLVLYAGSISVSYFAFADILGKAKPISLEYWVSSADEATVQGAVIREGVGIFIYIEVPGVPEPLSYKLPWRRDFGQQLQDALAQAQKNGTGVKMRLPFEPTWDGRETKFYAMPQPRRPQKVQPEGEEPPQRVERSA
jgi:hypothetical protein